jgi:hypothetical protein
VQGFNVLIQLLAVTSINGVIVITIIILVLCRSKEMPPCCRVVNNEFSQTDANNDEITRCKMGKTEAENPGFGGCLNPDFGFEKSLSYLFTFGHTGVANPSVLNTKSLISLIQNYKQMPTTQSSRTMRLTHRRHE